MAVAACALAGCSQPAVPLKRPAFQTSENSIRDWNEVAHRIADQMTARGLLPIPGQPQPAFGATVRPVYIRVQAPDSAFLHQVATQLESIIILTGAVVARAPAEATVVNLDVDFIRWSGGGTTIGPLYEAAAIAVGAFTDTVVAFVPTSRTEIVWQATIVADDQVLMNLHDKAYIREDDIPLYARATKLAPIASMGVSTQTPRARQIRYDP
jgi:hypothetical protein